MKQIPIRLSVALLTFVAGVIAAGLLRGPIPQRAEMPPALESVPTINLYNEAVLRAELLRMRALIRQYNVKQGEPARSLDDLFRERHLRELPVDPMTGQRNWQTEELGCPSSGGWYSFAVLDVHSRSMAISSSGTPYGEW